MLLLRDLVRRKVLREHTVLDSPAVSRSAGQIASTVSFAVGPDVFTDVFPDVFCLCLTEVHMFLCDLGSAYECMTTWGGGGGGAFLAGWIGA